MEITKETIIKTAIEEITQSAWEFASFAIWQNYNFNPEEEKEIKKQIRKHFEGIKLAKNPLFTGVKELLEFIARIELAVHYIHQKPGRWIAHPAIWFNPNNRHGYIHTAVWFEEQKLAKKYGKIKFFFENNKIEKVVR